MRKAPLFKYAEAKEFLAPLKIDSLQKWRIYNASPERNPRLSKAPDTYYRLENRGWKGWADFFGVPSLKQKHVYFIYPFLKARKIARSWGIKGVANYEAYYKKNRPYGFPFEPDSVYRQDGWISWYDFLGYTSIGVRFLPYFEATQLVWKYQITSIPKWKKWARSDKRPSNIPYNPDRVYRDTGWVSWGHWLGKFAHLYVIKDRYLPYCLAYKHSRKLRIKSFLKWKRYVKKNKLPENIPPNPEVVYKGIGWVNWQEWLGSKGVYKTSDTFRPFEEARDYVRSLGISNQSHWEAYCQNKIKNMRKPIDIPSNPGKIIAYRGKWVDWYDWLGTERRR